MKQYSTVVAKDLSFTYVKRYIYDNKGYTFMTYKDWEGFYFVDIKGRLCTYTKNGEIIVDVPLKAVQKQNERGWMIVKPSYFTLNDLDDFLDWDNM